MTDKIVFRNYHESGVIDNLHESLHYVAFVFTTDGKTTSGIIPDEFMKQAGRLIPTLSQYPAILFQQNGKPSVKNLKLNGNKVTWEYDRNVNRLSIVHPVITIFKEI